MTDITDQDRRKARAWAEGIVGGSTETIAAARVILATVDAPAPTLAEELRGIREWVDWEAHTGFDKIVARADQIEQERDKAIRRADQSDADLAEVLDSRDEARAEVDRLTEERDVALTEMIKSEQKQVDLEAEVERLTAALNAPDQRSNSSETPNSSFPDPADVKPGEAWIVEFEGHSTIGKRDTVDEEVPWALLEGRWVSDSAITLVSRLVPAPRVITDPEELEQLAATSIIRDGRGWPGGITDQGVTMINGFCLSDEEVLAHGPATVLWEAGE